MQNTYTTLNEDGTIVEHDRKEEKLQEYLNEIRISHAYVVNQYEALQQFNPSQVFNDFQTQANAIIDEIDSLEGDLYTQEGKNAEIRKQIEAAAEDKKQEADQLQRRYEEQYAALLDTIDKELIQGEELTADEVAQITLRNNELLGEIRGLLHTVNNTRDLEHEFKRLAEQAKQDKSMARFLTKNYYLFMDRAQELETSEMDKQRAIHQIKLLADEARQEAYSKKERALYVLRERLGNQSFSVIAPKRNIDQHLALYSRQYA